MNLTKKYVKENLIDLYQTEVDSVWKELKKENLAEKYLSTKRIKKFWNRFRFIFKDSMIEQKRVDVHEVKRQSDIHLKSNAIKNNSTPSQNLNKNNNTRWEKLELE